MACIALCIIATNDYLTFVEPLIESAKKHFLINHRVQFHVFSNGIFGYGPIPNVYHYYIKHEPWPAMTLKRYHIMSAANFKNYDYVYYIDADMLFVAPVGDEILAPLTGVFHPGYYVTKKGDWETREKSTAYVMPCKRKVYLAGGFQGGAEYFKAAKYLAEMINYDDKASITAKWHDESHWNKFYTMHKSQFKILNPSYCMVEEPEKRKLWGIDHFEPKIIALSKEHSKYQK